MCWNEYVGTNVNPRCFLAGEKKSDISKVKTGWAGTSLNVYSIVDAVL